jgi:hypothetical protein
MTQKTKAYLTRGTSKASTLRQRARWVDPRLNRFVEDGRVIEDCIIHISINPPLILLI